MPGEAEAALVADLYAGAEQQVLARLAALLMRGVDLPGWELLTLTRLQALRAQAVQALASADAQAAALIEQAIAATYAQGTAFMLADLGPIDPLDVSSAAQRAAVRSLAADTLAVVTSTRPTMLRAVDDLYRQVVAESVGLTVTRAAPRRTLVQQTLTRLASSGVRGFTDRAGRRWGLAEYVDMATRTGTHNAYTRGHEDVLDANGLDLCIIQPGPRACDICDRWARVILARNGSAGTHAVKDWGSAKPSGTVQVHAAATLAQARAAGFQHPNCRCSLRAWIGGITHRADIKRPPWDEAGYRAQQQQRGIERRIRAAKSRAAVAVTPEAQAEAQAGVRAQQAAMRAHLAEHPALKRQSAREQVVRAA